MIRNKLIAVINLWDGGELLPFQLDNICPMVDKTFVVYSNFSNYGESITHVFPERDNVEYVNWEPERSATPHGNEICKRNFGLQMAKNAGASHFLMLDCDEFYDHEDFEEEKDRIYKWDLNGLIGSVIEYFKEPTLTLPSETLIPFIHKIVPGIRYSFVDKKYPFAYDASSKARIDPTRRLNVYNGIEWSGIKMHHYSWVRHDIGRKIRNSSARKRLESSGIIDDYLNAKEGYFCESIGKTLVRCENKFNIQL
jgi:hypothetical protein